MKLICLNIQGGTLHEPLLKFVERHSADTDVFCFQEVFDTTIPAPPPIARGARATIYRDIMRILVDFEGRFMPTMEGWDYDKPVSFPLWQGSAIFVRKTIPVTAAGAEAILKGYNAAGQSIWSTMPRILQYADIASPNGPLTVAHLHGLLDNGKKWDTPARTAQFEAVRDFLAAISHAKVFCGDLNVRPGTEGIRIFEQTGMRNLIKEFGVTLTRNHHYPGVALYNDTVSDYLFVSPEIRVKTFEVLPDVVSDHLALAVEFE